MDTTNNSVIEEKKEDTIPSSDVNVPIYQHDSSVELSDTKNFTFHQVLPSDTFQSLAVRYGVTVGDIRRVNNIYANTNIPQKRILIIPKGRAGQPMRATQDDIVGLFCQLTRTDRQRARFYLEESGFCIDRAVALHEEDEAWAAQQGPMRMPLRYRAPTVRHESS
eukprot:gnl/Trimastix_PCT/3469.p1 GENE.gnl/Trimastix_PCT/3469~~gnl/Trimastix_PCT/3469.p1  ORF type:complete len:165 (+),score=15.79 gnl/Trimastix_PCT/3469:86-580(+)